MRCISLSGVFSAMGIFLKERPAGKARKRIA
jgi:hypothetical protein